MRRPHRHRTRTVPMRDRAAYATYTDYALSAYS
jgi:hypothetical protein